MNPNIILTSCNKKFGNFLIGQWLRSLQLNVNLIDTDIAIIDYGLSEEQRTELRKKNVILYPARLTGEIVNNRFIDAKKFLLNSRYKQVLFIDSGDVIFQSDISHLFTFRPNEFRVVKQDVRHLYFHTHIIPNFRGDLQKKLWHTLKDRDLINAGMILAPVEKFIPLCEEIEHLLGRHPGHGSDQVIVNYLLHKNGTVFLDKSFNYMVSTNNESFSVRDGIFCRPDGSVPAIVHNVGRLNFSRPIAHFGYGKGHNIKKPFSLLIRRLIFSITK